MAELPPRVWPDQEIHDELKLDQESFKSCAWGQKDVNAAPSLGARALACSPDMHERPHLDGTDRWDIENFYG